MRFIATFTALASTCVLTACVAKGTNPVDPYESLNRETHKFNMAFDATFLKPPAKFYKAVVPSPIRAGINNAYNNIDLIPSVANDLLQGDWNYAVKDTGRFLINSTLGIAGLFDVATRFNLPPHSNDLGLTFAKWGDKQSPYLVIPFLGPSTFRDGMGMMFQYTFLTPYPYIPSDAVLYSILGLRYVDLRSQMLETDRLIDESLDKYSFIRDAYLQHRNFRITGEQDDTGSLYVDEGSDFPLTDGPMEPPPGAGITASATMTTHAAHSTTPA